MQGRSQLCVLAVSLTLLTVPSRARATGEAVTPPTVEYGYEFTDDPLLAGGFTALDPPIFVVSRSIRATLIRPRTAFVVEMLKSVESL